MKEKDLQNIYGNPTQDFHNSMLCALCKIDDKATKRYKKRSRAVRIAVVCAIVAALGSFTTVAATTKFFGLFQQQVGKYGLNVGVETTKDENEIKERPKYVKLKFGYMTEGFTESPTSGGMKYNNGEEGGAGYSFEISREEDFNYTAEYIIASEETVVNGHKLIVADRQIEEGGDVSYIAYEYFEDWGYVVSCIAHHGAEKEELIKIMQNLDLEEDKDFVPIPEPEDVFYDEERENYQGIDRNYFSIKKLGEQFGWEAYFNDGENADDFTIQIDSITEQSTIDSLDYNVFEHMSDFAIAYDNYFDESGTLITPYTRTDYEYGDGINSQDKSWQTVVDRHFYVVKVSVTSNVEPSDDIDSYENWFDGSNLNVFPIIKDSDGNYNIPYNYDENGVAQIDVYGDASVVYYDGCDEYQLAKINKGETRTFTYGIVVDDDVLDSAYVTFTSQNINVSDEDEAVYYDNYHNCVKLKR